MAPVPSNSISLDDDQRFALMKFRRSVKDILKPEHNDQFLLRWLRVPWESNIPKDHNFKLNKYCNLVDRIERNGFKTDLLVVTMSRQWNAEAAEKMLRDSMEWREKWGIDTTLAQWKAPEVLEKHFPSGSTGFDKEGSPVIIVPFAGLDVWGLLHSVSRADCIRMVLKHLEGYMILARKQAETHGPNALKLVAVMDMEGFNMKQYAWRPAAEMVFSLLQMYEANYPEILKTCLIINAPKVFSLAFSIIKKFMHEYTISKIKIYKADPKKWQSQLLNLVDADQLPVHYGGTLTDPETGDERCTSIVKMGGKVPKSCYTRRGSDEKNKNFSRITVKTGEAHSVDLICAQPGCMLKWEFGVESHDIKFLIKSRDEDGNESVVHGPRKVSGAGTVDTGVLSVSGPATYTVIFDNTSSYLRSKKVFYDVLIAMPSDLNLVNLPDDDDEKIGATQQSMSSLTL